MFGAILGDIIGSRFEFDRGGKTTEFQLFTPEDSYTDDTVMTAAVADALLSVGRDAAPEEIRRACTEKLRAWGKAYPDAGYGCRFLYWLFGSEEPAPYHSFGNGSAMRVSPAGWLYDTLDRTREAARATAEITHDHPEGIKGAECTAAVIFLARTGTDKAEIRTYVEREFGYDLSETPEQLRARHAHVETCRDSMPKALVSFFAGSSFEEVVRIAVSLGGDTDTIGAIAGSMAEAMYGIPLPIFVEGMAYLPEDLRAVVSAFREALGGTTDSYRNNGRIRQAVRRLHAEPGTEQMEGLMEALLLCMAENGEAPTPMEDVNGTFETIDVKQIVIGSTMTLDRALHLRFTALEDSSGDLWLPLFTDEEELNRGESSNFCINASIESILESGLNSDRAKGVVINPFGQSFTLEKPILGLIMEAFRNWKEENERGNKTWKES